MSNFYLPVSALAFCILINVIFFSRDNVNNYETSFFSRLLKLSLFDCIVTFIIILISYYWYYEPLVIFLNRISYIIYIIWIYNYFMYTFYLTFNNNEGFRRDYKFFGYLCGIFNSIVILSIMFYDINIINSEGLMYSYGFAADILIAGCVIYVILIYLLTFCNFKIIDKKKNIPLVILFFLFVFVAIVRYINPAIVVLPTVLTFVNFILYFTIENPDIRVIKSLNKAALAEKNANKAKTDFLSSMSHEIRTPLNAIMGFSECINLTNDINEAHENASDIIEASATLLEIVNGILDISKIEAGKLELVKINYNFNDLVNEVCKIINVRLDDKNIKFKVSVASDIPPILYGDKMNVKKIIMNLVSNAVKYTKEGFINLDIKCVMVQDVCRLFISCEDSGRGIKKSEIDLLFKKFNRLDEVKNSTIEGTGLGLCITKQLAEMMNGNVSVKSIYGEGSMFIASIDQEIGTGEVIVKQKVVNNRDFSGFKVLVVDDNLVNIKVATKILNRYGIEVFSCLSGSECLELVSKNKYDLILLDDMMPNMRGTEVMEQLVIDKNFDVPVIVLTANAISGVEDFYISKGFNAYLSKPIDSCVLYELLDEFLVLKKKVLVVDDNAMNLKIAVKFLTTLGYDVSTCLSGFECLDLVKVNHYDIIFMDIMMPLMDGVEALGKLKEFGFSGNVIALTADTANDASNRYLNAGFDAYISKPVTIDILRETIAKL